VKAAVSYLKVWGDFKEIKVPPPAKTAIDISPTFQYDNIKKNLLAGKVVILMSKLLTRILLSTLLTGALSATALTTPVSGLMAAPAATPAQTDKTAASPASSRWSQAAAKTSTPASP
jgi:hypothetical protein